MKNLNNYAVIDYTVEQYSKYCSTFTFDLQKNRPSIHHPGFHGCFLGRNNKLIFMHIDKCASSSMKVMLKNNNFCDMSFRVKDVGNTKKYFIKNNYNFYAIIRDPRTRYISGLQEFIKRYNPPPEYVIDNLKRNKFIFDEHTSPQHCFLFLCDDKCNYIKMDENLSSKLSKIINKDITLEKRNKSIPRLKSDCEELFEQYCENNPLFYKLYENDYKMYHMSL